MSAQSSGTSQSGHKLIRRLRCISFAWFIIIALKIAVNEKFYYATVFYWVNCDESKPFYMITLVASSVGLLHMATYLISTAYVHDCSGDGFQFT